MPAVKKILNPRNGQLWCPECETYPKLPEWEGAVPKNAKAKPGERCTNCNDPGWDGKPWQQGGGNPDAVYEIDKRTVLGPANPIELTGNPLLDAATVLKLDGWVSGDFVCAEGKKCLAGAIHAASGIFSDPEKEHEAWARRYVNSEAYREAKRKSIRAELTLAEAIVAHLKAQGHEPDEYGLKVERRILWTGIKMEEAKTGPYASFDTVMELARNIIYTYNDDVMSRGDEGRQRAMDILHEAAESFRPRRRVTLVEDG